MTLKQTEQDALTLARVNGMVHAGKNYPPKGLSLDDGCRLSRVHHATITAMVRKGLLVACHSSDGGYAGMIPSGDIPDTTNTTETMNESQKRKAALDAMDAYKAHAANRSQQIADEAAAMMQRFGAVPSTYPATAEFLRLRDIADTLRKEVQP